MIEEQIHSLTQCEKCESSVNSVKAAVKLLVGSSIPNQLPYQQGLIGHNYSGKQICLSHSSKI